MKRPSGGKRRNRPRQAGAQAKAGKRGTGSERPSAGDREVRGRREVTSVSPPDGEGGRRSRRGAARTAPAATLNRGADAGYCGRVSGGLGATPQGGHDKRGRSGGSSATRRGTYGGRGEGLDLGGPELMPVQPGSRRLTNIDYMVIWLGMAVQLFSFVIGAQLYPGLSPGLILGACVLAHVLTVIVYTLTGDIGIRYGITYSVYIRACFGYFGTHIPGILRAGVGLFFFGLLTFLGAAALDIVVRMATGYSNMGLMITIFTACEMALAIFGLKAIARFNMISAPLLTAVVLYLTVALFREHHLSIAGVLGAPSNYSIGLTYAAFGMAGAWSTLMLSIPDFTRNLRAPLGSPWHVRNFGSFWSQLIGFVPAITFYVFVGLTSSLATGDWNPINVLDMTFRDRPILLALMLILLMFSQWGGATASSLVPPAYVILNLWPGKVRWVHAVVISGVLGTATQPWLLLPVLPKALVYVTATVTPIVGIMVCDYYVLRRCEINLRDLYRSRGQYGYWRSVNPAAVISLVAGAAAGLAIADYSWPVAFAVGGAVYYLLMKAWIIRRYPQSELATPGARDRVAKARSAEGFGR